MKYSAPSRRRFLSQLLTGCVTAGLCAKGFNRVHAAGNRPPNILLILADDVGREVLGCYGGTTYETPHLDALARTGMRFTHGYAMPVCHPSRMCLMTGTYPFRMNNPAWGQFPRHAEDQTIAHVLKRAGYATAVAGKWQLTLLKSDPQHPKRLGFDESCLFGWHEGPRYYAPLLWQNGQIREDIADRYGPDVYCDFLTEFMDRNKDRPFFAYYSMALCHDVTNDLEAPVPFAPGKDRYDSYGEMVAAMDQRVGRLVAELEERGLRENTLVLFVADNGTPSRPIAGVEGNEFLREPVISTMGELKVPGGKGQTTDWGTRVPWIANWPGTVQAGQVSNDLVDLTDLLPTVAELAGTPIPTDAGLDGKSFSNALHGRAPGSRTWVYSEHKTHRCVRDQRYRLYADGRFYDAEADPFEKSPLDTDSLETPVSEAYKMLSDTLNLLLTSAQ